LPEGYLMKKGMVALFGKGKETLRGKRLIIFAEVKREM